MRLRGVKVLAFGTAGAQGSGLVEALHAHGARPVLASSRPERVRTWQDDGREAVVADLGDPDSVGPAGAGAAVLHVPLGMAGPQGITALVASIARLRAAGLPVAVNLGTPVPPEDAPDLMGARGTAAAVLATGATVLTPTGYLENHAAPWALGPLSRGELVYPRPPSDPVAWIAAGDMTAAAVASLARDCGAQVLRLAGPRPLTFTELAGEIGAGLGRRVTFRQVTPHEYADLLRPVLGEGAAAGVEAGYAAMPPDPNPLMTIDAAQTWRALGVEPTPAHRWAEQVLAPLLTAAAPH